MCFNREYLKMVLVQEAGDAEFIDVLMACCGRGMEI